MRQRRSQARYCRRWRPLETGSFHGHDDARQTIARVGDGQVGDGGAGGAYFGEQQLTRKASPSRQPLIALWARAATGGARQRRGAQVDDPPVSIRAVDPIVRRSQGHRSITGAVSRQGLGRRVDGECVPGRGLGHKSIGYARCAGMNARHARIRFDVDGL